MSFQELINTLKPSITQPNYWVDWQKVSQGYSSIEVSLNILNTLVGKDDIKSCAINLLKEYPECIKVLPIVLATRDKHFSILSSYDEKQFVHKEYDFSKSTLSAEEAVEFLERTGFLEELKAQRITSIPNYVFGVEAGLDSNGRKNRGGKAMEDVTEYFISLFCKQHSFTYLKYATASKIKQNFGYDVVVDKTSRSFDFAINTGSKLFLIEVNFYTGSGSKLKATAGEYKDLNRMLLADGKSFIWITDGAGWHSAKRPLEEAYSEIKNVINLSMLQSGALDKIILGRK